MIEKGKRGGLKRRLPAIAGGKPAFDEPVPITRPTITGIGGLVKGYRRILESGMITNAGYVKEFENRVAEYTGARHAIALASCTSGLMLIMKALGLKGEVILPSFTFHATAHAVVWNGLKPVFVDCDPATYNIDPEEAEKAITPATSAILAVYIFGNPPDMDKLERIARRRDLKLIFDAAHGFGSVYKGRNAGTFGDAESFSLSPTKLVTAGEGGVVTTNDDKLAGMVRIGRNYGDPGTYDCAFSGLSARMDEFSGLLGIEGLKRLEAHAKRRNSIAALYTRRLSKLEGLTFQKIEGRNRSSYKDFSILVDGARFGITRDVLADALAAEKIVTKKYFYPAVHDQKIFLGFRNGAAKFEATERLAGGSLSLPLYSDMPLSDVERICDTIERIHGYYKRPG
ncbi:MAG: DegT/DnrJ/EryC1/StrS family aminotransferase [Candidatus Omnitrophota bacterium]